jgi:hypothetical protein
MLTDFEKNCYHSPLTLENAKENTFLESTSLSTFEDNNFRFWLGAVGGRLDRNLEEMWVACPALYPSEIYYGRSCAPAGKLRGIMLQTLSGFCQ